MKPLLSFLLSLVIVMIIGIANGQGSAVGLRFKACDTNYNWGKASQAQYDSFYFNLKPIQASNVQTSFRISIPGQIIDLYSKDDSSYEGILTNEITQYGYEKRDGQDDKQSIPTQKIYEKIPLDATTVELVMKALLSSGQTEIPTDSLLPGWERWITDCSPIQFQHKINGRFTTQHYYCLWGQNDFAAFKSVIAANYNLIKSAFSLDTLYKNFKQKLPKGETYSNDGFGMLYVLTDIQVENRRVDKPRRDYIKSIKDTVDSYLNAVLLKQNIQLKDIDCFNDYQIVIGKNGRLQKVYLFSSAEPKRKHYSSRKDYMEKKREILECKAKVRQIFSEIDLSFMNLEYDIDRTFSFSSTGEFILSDNNIYW